MKRRSLIAGAASLLAAPSVRAAEASVLRFVPNTEPPVLDPVTNTAAQTRTHAFLVWDTLYGLDTEYEPQPQMLAGHTIEQGGKLWTLTLRPGLRFHDGTPVLARDVTASVRRWGAADGFGGAVLAATDELAEVDDRTIRFRMKAPFPLLAHALGKMSPNIAPIMPARLASAPANQPVKEIVGSGPFRFVASERVPGSRMVYERFDGYVPREDGPAGFTSGPKRVFFDRIEWSIMPEAATAAAALRAGEVDWVETPSPDLLPLLRGDPALMVSVNDTTGVMPVLRFNSIQPPFDKVAVRRAVFSAVSQADFLAAFSSDKGLQRSPVGAFCPGSPMDNDAGFNLLPTHPDIEAAKRAVAGGRLWRGARGGARRERPPGEQRDGRGGCGPAQTARHERRFPGYGRRHDVPAPRQPGRRGQGRLERLPVQCGRHRRVEPGGFVPGPRRWPEGVVWLAE